MKKLESFAIRRTDIIVGLYIFLIVASELFGAKTFPILNVGDFHLNASVAIFLLPFVFSLSDIMLEVHGRKRAKGLVYLGIGVIVLLMLFAALATALPPSSRFAPHEAGYDEIFNFGIRISFASLAAFAVSELLDVAIFARLREKMKNKALWLRNNLSNFIAFFVDSAVFLTLAFYAFDKTPGANFTFILGLLIPYWLLKCFMSIIETPLVYAGVKWLKKDSTK
jgi:uncharacterized integral membrane protein (TIGR00697 family)